MANRQDILMDSEGNWMVENGDFVIGESDDQHVEILLASRKGMIRETPVIGAGITDFVNKQNIDLNGLEREITVNLQADGYKSKKLAFDENNEFNLDYETNY